MSTEKLEEEATEQLKTEPEMADGPTGDVETEDGSKAEIDENVQETVNQTETVSRVEIDGNNMEETSDLSEKSEFKQQVESSRVSALAKTDGQESEVDVESENSYDDMDEDSNRLDEESDSSEKGPKQFDKYEELYEDDFFHLEVSSVSYVGDSERRSVDGSFAEESVSYKSETTQSAPEDVLPRNMTEYVEKYHQLFASKFSSEEMPCSTEVGKAFLKIDLNDITVGYRKNMEIRNARSYLSGLTRVRGDLVVNESGTFILRKNYDSIDQVKLVSGGHAGREPLYSEYIGRGLLTAAVLGSTVDPPSVDDVASVLRELKRNSPPGILIIIQNDAEYRLVFGLAMERIRTEGFGNIDIITVGDDCFERSTSPVGRRGLAGIVLMYKLAGSMADSGQTFKQIYISLRAASKDMVTLSCVTRPFRCIGMGLDRHSREGDPVSDDDSDTMRRIMDYCLNPTRYFALYLHPGESVVLLVNGYKTKSPELYAVVDSAVRELERRKVDIERVYCDNFVTGFWHGFSITLLADHEEKRANHLDSMTSSSLWPQTPSKPQDTRRLQTSELTPKKSFPNAGPILNDEETMIVRRTVMTACKAMILCENVLNSFHFFGNYGSKLRRGAEGVLTAWNASKLTLNRPFNLLIEISELLTRFLPGATGAMYGCLFEGAARSFLKSSLSSVSAQSWSEAMDEALKTLRSYTRARGGIVSLALALIPVVSAIHGTFVGLQQQNKNTILSALDSLRNEVEERLRSSVEDNNDSILKNQLDVESYALAIWLHSVYSCVYWKDSAEVEDTNSTSSAVKYSPTTNVDESNQRKFGDSVISKRSKVVNTSLEFVAGRNSPLRTFSTSAVKSAHSNKPSNVSKIYS